MQIVTAKKAVLFVVLVCRETAENFFQTYIFAVSDISPIQIQTTVTARCRATLTFKVLFAPFDLHEQEEKVLSVQERESFEFR